MSSQLVTRDLIGQIKNSRKYRHMDIPDETIVDLLEQESALAGNSKGMLRAVKKQLHNIMAPYLGDIDYKQASENLEDAFTCGDDEVIKLICRDILAQHHSTRERLNYYDEYFQTIKNICDHLDVILDLACGFNPFALPYSGLPVSTRYYAFDIHAPRIELINLFLKLSGMKPLAELRDVLVRPPDRQADAAFLFKEAHRMEKRRKGSSAALINALNARYIFISLPTRSLDGRRDLRERMRNIVKSISTGRFELLDERVFESEVLFSMSKIGG